MSNTQDEPADPRQSLLENAALILEQEGWLLGRMVYVSGSSRRLQQFADRYQEWQDQVKAYRDANPGVWPEPPDNS
jgi:hypothetical protein